jgi:hypothetical protein
MTLARIVTGILSSCLSIVLSGNSNLPSDRQSHNRFSTESSQSSRSRAGKRKTARDLYSLRPALSGFISLPLCHLVILSSPPVSRTPPRRGNNFSSKSKAVGAAKSRRGGKGGGGGRSSISLAFRIRRPRNDADLTSAGVYPRIPCSAALSPFSPPLSHSLSLSLSSY